MKESLKSLLITLLLLAVTEVLSSTIFPALGLTSYFISFHVLLVLYMAFKFDGPYQAFHVLLINYVHSVFSIEGWEMGTIAGVLVCLIVSYLKDLIHLSNIFMTMLLVQVFQIVWFIFVSFIIVIRVGNFEYVMYKFWNFMPVSLILSFIAPFVFHLLDKIWANAKSGSMVGEEA